MIGYVCVGTNDLKKAEGFYSQLLGIMGAKETYRGERGVGFGLPDKPMISVLKPFDGKPASVGNGSMISLAAADADQVKALHAKCLSLGGTCEGPPGERGNGFYAAYFRDLDGNKLGAYCMVK
jgi:catechol 2,3-dioxygenase-like lactoylglutathione lyase family enzyme